MIAGKLYGLGLGPGDPELITLKAARLLSHVPVVAYPASPGQESFARGIASGLITPQQQEIRIDVPMSLDPAPAAGAYDRGARNIAACLDRGLDVALLCQGDPFFYGSFIYLFARLATRYQIEIVPGVSSVMAAAAASALPLAVRGDAFAVLPATLGPEGLRQRLVHVDAVAIIKLGRHLPEVRQMLTEMDLLDRAQYVERVSLGNQRILKLRDLDAETAPYFSMILVTRAESLNP